MERQRSCFVIFALKSNTDEIPRLIQMDDTVEMSAASCTAVVSVPISEGDQLLCDHPTYTSVRATTARFCR